MASSGNSSKRPGSGKESKRTQTVSKVGSTKMTTTFATNLSSPPTGHGARATPHDDQSMPASNTSDGFLVEPASGPAAQGSMAGSATQYTVGRREYYLQGLTLQSSHSPPNGLPDASPSSRCPVHSTLLSGSHPRHDPAPPSGTMPMERYLEERPAERYGLVNLNQPDIGDWARCIACTCESGSQA